MLRSLVKTSLRYRFVVLIGAVALIVFGVLSTMRSPLDVFPEFAPPRVEVQTEAPGMSSEAVESLVSIPLENAVNGIPHMTTLRSKSVQGLSSVVMLFQPGTDLFVARQMVAERIALARATLPQQARAPQVMPPLSSTSRVLHIGLTPKPKDKLKPGEKELSQIDVSVLNRWVITPALLRVEGVANISTYGHYDKRYHVYVKPRDLRDHGVTLEQVKTALRKSVVYGAAGYHVTPNQQLGVNYVTTIDRPIDLAQTVVAHVKGQPVYLGQVAKLTTGKPQDIGEGVINDRPGLFVVVEKFPWANTLKVTRDVEKVLARLAPGLPGVEITPDPLRPQTEAEDNICIFRPATFIEQALDNLTVAMIIGCVLVALILLAFLFEWRTAAISLTAIPLSIVTALLILSRLGVTINTMVLAGLAIAIGEVVDDAIIDVENIVRRLRENHALGHPRSAFRVVLDASLEVRSAVVYASFIVVFVCLPIFFLGGVAGAFFQPLALAYILAVMASLGVALVITPALCYMMLPRALERSGEPPLVHVLRAGYRRFLPLALNRGWLAIGLLVVLGAAAAVLYPRLKEEYLPQFQETDFLMHWVAKPGTSIDVMRKDICKVSEEMGHGFTAVKAFGSHIARAEVGEEVYGPNFSELWVSFGNFKGDYDAARRKVEEVMARHPGFQHDLLTYLQERIKEVLTGTGATIVMRIYGPELDGLRQEAQRIKSVIEKGGPDGTPVAGVADLKVEPQVLIPQIEVKVDEYRCGRYGLTREDVAGALTTLIGGTKVAEVHQDQKVFDVYVWGHPKVRRTY
ncbi:MAG TPA: efflux RND transporter permease subunit, partial [Gemmataceae bacterium]|nr:efflux RND transporter permease subunit [Gemmataceae bacterium]